jgi:DNA-binding LytR/AlgR family response regulator
MKVNVKYRDDLQDNEIVLEVSPTNKNTNSYIRILNGESVDFITGKQDEKMFLIDLYDIESFYTKNGKVFFFSNGQEYFVSKKLYEIEEAYQHRLFMRISKAVIVNLNKVEYLAPAFNRQLKVKLFSGREEYSSRNYYKSIKERLEV